MNTPTKSRKGKKTWTRDTAVHKNIYLETSIIVLLLTPHLDFCRARLVANLDLKTLVPRNSNNIIVIGVLVLK